MTDDLTDLARRIVGALTGYANAADAKAIDDRGATLFQQGTPALRAMHLARVEFVAALLHDHDANLGAWLARVGKELVIDYVNHRGVRAERHIVINKIHWGESEWHPGPQWLAEAWDCTKGKARTFALAGVHGVREVPVRSN